MLPHGGGAWRQPASALTEAMRIGFSHDNKSPRVAAGAERRPRPHGY
jgi:hypothetical protein